MEGNALTELVNSNKTTDKPVFEVAMNIFTYCTNSKQPGLHQLTGQKERKKLGFDCTHQFHTFSDHHQ